MDSSKRNMDSSLLFPPKSHQLMDHVVIKIWNLITNVITNVNHLGVMGRHEKNESWDKEMKSNMHYR